MKRIFQKRLIKMAKGMDILSLKKNAGEVESVIYSYICRVNFKRRNTCGLQFSVDQDQGIQVEFTQRDSDSIEGF